MAMNVFPFMSYSQQDSLATDSIDFPSELNYIDFDSGIDSVERSIGAGTTKFSAVSDSPEIEDVVVRLRGIEVITNEEGIASIMNVGVGKHQLNVFLDDLGTWFPNVEDSLVVLTKGIYYLPFTRGIKVYGDVVLDRQKIAVADISKLFDLSRIKITAMNNGKTYETLTNVRGSFEFYMPNGDYLITMDSRVLTNRYRLTRNNLPVTLTQDQSGIYVSFFIVERRKRVVIKTFGSPTE